MDLEKLQKDIHDAAMAVRKGDWSQWDKLQELRKQHRAACGVPEHAEAVSVAPEVPKPADKPKRKSKKDDAE